MENTDAAVDTALFHMAPKVRQAYLYDFYGELLNGHQRRIFEYFVFDDLSLGEIAQELGVSRQAVHDIVRRSTEKLEGYEEKLHLLARFMEMREKASGIQERVAAYEQTADSRLLEEIRQISEEIIRGL